MTTINLLPWREIRREQEKKQFMTLLMLVAMCAISFVFMINYYASGMVEDQRQRNERLQEEITAFNAQIVEIKQLKEVRDSVISRMKIVHGLQARRTLTVHLFDELIKVLPDGVYLTELRREEDRITVQGYSESNSNISILMRNIQQNPWIQDPVLTEIKRTDDEEKLVSNEFNLSFTLKPQSKPVSTP